jgi:hypothetical protein
MIKIVAVVALLLLGGCEISTQVKVPMTPEQVYNLQSQCVAMGLKPMTETFNGDVQSVKCEVVYRDAPTPTHDRPYSGVNPPPTGTTK